MLSLEQAVDDVLALVHPLPAELVRTSDALGAVLAADLVATVDTPPFDASAMDGFAVRAADLDGAPVELRVVGTASSGHPSDAEVVAGTAARILTGAVVPAGADAVVPVEDTDAGTDVVTVRASVPAGRHIRVRGEVGRAGDLLITAPALLTAGHLGVAAANGLAEVLVHRAPKVAIVTTGDELVSPGHGELGPGQIYDSNSTLSEQLVTSAGGVAHVVHAADDAPLIGALLEALAPEVDLILTSGGISMGAEFDPLRAALGEHPVRFEQVAIRPAKPLAFGRVGECTYIGLPGNPVSVVVAFELFVRPALRRLRGIDPAVAPRSTGRLANDLERADDGKTHLVPVAVRQDGTWEPTPLAGSHALVGVAAASALAVVPNGRPRLTSGSEVELLPLWG